MPPCAAPVCDRSGWSLLRTATFRSGWRAGSRAAYNPAPPPPTMMTSKRCCIPGSPGPDSGRAAAQFDERTTASCGDPPQPSPGGRPLPREGLSRRAKVRSEEHTSELQSQLNLVCRLLLEKKKFKKGKQRHTKQTLSRSQLPFVYKRASAHYWYVLLRQDIKRV